MSAHRPGRIARWLLRAPARLYDWHAGWLLGHWFVRLTHVGRRSGRRYQTMLEVVGTSRDGAVTVMAGFGTSTDWFRNVQAHPAAEVAIGRRRFQPVCRMLDEREAMAVMADYERRNRWMAPVVRRGLSWLAGWPYDSSDDARQRLVRQLPLLEFQPR